jgi:TonB-dependent starch-binding outer membrane protein SusC
MKIIGHLCTFYFKKGTQQTLLVMKLSIVLLFAFCLQLSARVHSQNMVSLNLRNTQLSKVFNEIERNTDYKFLYADNILPDDKKITINVTDVPVTDVLNTILAGTSLQYKISDKNLIVISEKNIAGILKITVKGKITNVKGEPIAGASILEMGTKNGTTTDQNGEYIITVENENSSLEITAVGYAGQEIKTAGKTEINISLKEKDARLADVVVIGYGSVQRKNLTYAVGGLTSKDIKEQPIATFQQALQGKIAGVQVTQPSGRPGSALKVSVRNSSSITASNDPIYVIDGVISISTDGINPDDIENVQVLKDAAAQSIYGSRGANGVVLITTKRGKSGRLDVNASQQYGYTEVGKKLSMLNSEQFVSLINDAYTNSGLPPLSAGQLKTDVSTDWQKEIYGKVKFTNSQVSVGSGSEKYNYFLSLGYFKQNGIINPSDFGRWNLRLNNEYKLSKTISTGINFGLSRLSISDNVPNDATGPVLLALTTIPNIPVRNADGTYPRNPLQSAENPVAVVKGGGNKTYNNKYVGNVYLEAKLPSHFTFRTSYGVDANNNSRDFNLDPEITVQGNFLNGSQYNYTTDEYIWSWDNTLSYTNSFNDIHKVDVVGGHSAQRSTYTDGANKSLWSYDSYFARGNYGYKDKYLFSGSVRRESSSRFGPDNRISIFPSVSAAWRLTEEKFMKEIPFVYDLKLRVSYGQTGNSQGFGDFAYLGRRARDRNYPFNDVTNAGTVPVSITNNILGWEKIAQTNAGIDASFFNGRVSLSADYYLKRTTDLILNKNLPVTSGFNITTLNAGLLTSKGFELTLNTRNVSAKNFTWSSTVIYATSKVKVNKLVDNQNLYLGAVGLSQPAVIVQEGQSLGNFYGYISEGVDPKTGDLIYKDVNNNGVSSSGATFDVGDRTIIGNALPEFTLGFTNNFTYKSFDLNIFFDGVFGNDIFNATRVATEGQFRGWNQTTAVLRRWKTAGDITDVPRALYNDERNIAVSTRFIEKGDYIKLRSFTLGYTLNKVPAGISFLKGARIYAGGRNVFTITDYTGYDPEVNYFGTSGVVQGIDYGVYPQVRTFTLGLNVKF